MLACGLPTSFKKHIKLSNSVCCIHASNSSTRIVLFFAMSSDSSSNRSYYVYQNTYGFPDPTHDSSGSDRHPRELGFLTDTESDGTGGGPLFQRHPTRSSLVDLGIPNAQRAYIPSSRSEQLRLGFYGNNHFGSTGAYPTSQNGPNHNSPAHRLPSGYSQQFQAGFQAHNHAGSTVPYSAGGTHSRTSSGSSHGSGYASSRSSGSGYTSSRSSGSGYMSSRGSGYASSHGSGHASSRSSGSGYTSSRGSGYTSSRGYEASGSESDHSGEETGTNHPVTGHVPPGHSANANQPAAGRAIGHRRDPLGSVFGGGQYAELNQASTTATVTTAGGSTSNSMSELSQTLFWVCEYCGEQIPGTVTNTHYSQCNGFR
ncbi:hypothetical protein E1B28_013223 [Marasmius oreades]|uniref:Uncharacterized protein n=1 Tax=Marasmius oreades TaxID=181124 RepID=A0A9P7ULT7_9AGAR|nr:uncharacterized protein E1B28_013223 [Marasmius oreades]KAG7087242.1 hypothetical protein E1B28_013223 [Marasmius oreades]